MRKGKILCVNATEGKGLIKDENKQEIAFCLTETNNTIKINDVVWFEIELTNHGLTAVDIKAANDLNIN